MKTSRFLSHDFSITDAMHSPRSSKKKVNEFVEEGVNRMPFAVDPVTPEKELFKGISFKRLGSLESTDIEELSCTHGHNEECQIDLENPLEFEKIRLKLEKTEKNEKQQKRLDPNRHLWQESNEERVIKKVMTLRHISEIENKTAKIVAMKMSSIISPKTLTRLSL